LAAEIVRIDNASLASQAVGPPMSAVEMAYDGRTWPKLGKRVLPLRPLALQTVAQDDSVLGPSANPSGRGLAAPTTYLSLVQAAFRPEYWSSDALVDAAGTPLGRSGNPQSSADFTQAEYNFSLFFGLAVQAYESTLISAQTRFDRFAGGDNTALTPQEQTG